MNGALGALVWGGVGASSLLVGAVLALRTTPSNRTVGLVLAFGAGTLISAVAYELVPTETEQPVGVGAGHRPRRPRLLLRRQHRRADGRRAAETTRPRRGRPDSAPGPGRRSRSARSSTGSRSRSSWASGSRLGGAISVAFLVAVFISNMPEAIGASVSLRAAGMAVPLDLRDVGRDRRRLGAVGGRSASPSRRRSARAASSSRLSRPGPSSR